MVRFHPAPHLMKKLINEVLKVNKKFPQAMSKEGRFIDLVEEVGELANAILVTEKHKSKKCMRAEIADSFADILYDLIVLADLYELGLPGTAESKQPRRQPGRRQDYLEAPLHSAPLN